MSGQKKQALDKLIQKNIKKERRQQEEEHHQKQRAKDVQKQRQADLSQRNQEVRVLNASRYSKVDQNADITAEVRQSKRRAQSCIKFNERHQSLEAPTTSQ